MSNAGLALRIGGKGAFEILEIISFPIIDFSPDIDEPVGADDRADNSRHADSHGEKQNSG
jgi:hypothetical protein